MKKTNRTVNNKKNTKDLIIPLFGVFGLIIMINSMILLSGCITSEESDNNILLLATTTSTANSGLLDEIIPIFEAKYNCIVKITPVGTGQALEMGRRGDADALLVHAPSSEIEFVEQGYGTNRTLIMYNEFIIVGPISDPANISDTTNITYALKEIYDFKANFASRGDDSGTHKKEIFLWEQSGFDYEADIDIPGNNWYYSVSAGMGDCLTRSNELQAYTMTDEGTYFSYMGNLDLEIIVKGDQELFNQYSVIPVNPEKHAHVNIYLAEDFTQWLISDETQETIGSFQANGKQLFTPNAE